MTRRLVAGALLLLVAGCPAPVDVTPVIHVDPRAARRLAWFGSKAPATTTPASPPAARVRVMKVGDELRGPGATGRAGDLVLENAEIVLVVAQPSVDHGVATTGGCVVDAADAKTRQDELGGVCAYLGGVPPQDLCDALSPGTDPGGTAWIEARGRSVLRGTIELVTRYTLHAPDRAVLVESSIENVGNAPVDVTSLGDAVAWGNAERVAPGKRPGFEGESGGPYVGGVGHRASYALTSTEGSIEALSRDGWTWTSQRGKTSLAPHEKASWSRILVVGARPDTSSLVAELALAAGQPVGAVKIIPGELLPGTRLDLVPEGSTEALTLAAPYEGVLPVGRYSVRPPDDQGPLPVLDVTPDAVAELTLRPRP